MIFLGFSFTAFAINSKEACYPTPELSYFTDTPSRFLKNNNLTSTPGSYLEQQGQIIILRGRITDSNCVPISNAVIRIWQSKNKNCFSQNDTYINQNNKNNNDCDIDSILSGTAVTDNLGYYFFTTILPVDGFINLLLEHNDFIYFSTRILFDDYDIYGVNSDFHHLLFPDGPLLSYSGIDEYVFDITLDGINRYTGY